MLQNPDAFIRHELLAPIAQVMVAERSSKVAQDKIVMNTNGCPVAIFGEDMIEQEALNQIRVASKLPVSIQEVRGFGNKPEGRNGEKQNRRTRDQLCSASIWV